MSNFYAMVIVNYRNIKKYAKYISVYIKVKLYEILYFSETSKYDLSYMRYYIVITTRELIIIFWTNR